MAPKYSSHAKKYHVHLSRQRFPISCPYESCGQSVLVCHFERHCCDHHSMNSKLQCVWCYGRVSWAEGTKCKHMDHLQTCLRQFISNRRTAARVEAARHSEVAFVPPSMLSNFPFLMSLTPLCSEKTFFHYAEGEVSTFDQALDSFNLLDVQPTLLQYQDPQLNLSVSYLQTYLETCDTHEWLHVMVKLVAYPSFVRALARYRGEVYTLRFSCWCNGGQYDTERHRQHRHLILRTRAGLFASFWAKVILENPKDKPVANFPCKRSKPFKSPLHFVNTLGYLSRRKSRCQFSFEDEEKVRDDDHDQHFYIFEALPVDYKMILVGYWEKGIYELLYQERLQNVSLPRVTEKPLVYDQSQWKQKIKDFYALPTGLVLPVQKRFAPTSRITPIYYHLMEGRKLYFESDPKNETLDEEQWLWMQAQGGNCFYDVIGDFYWTPRPHDQGKLHEMMPYITQINNLHQELFRSEQEHQAQMTGLRKQYEAHMTSMREDYEAHITGIRKDYEAQITDLKTEMTTLKQRCETLQEKVQLDPVEKNVIHIIQDIHIQK